MRCSSALGKPRRLDPVAASANENNNSNYNNQYKSTIHTTREDSIIIDILFRIRIMFILRSVPRFKSYVLNPRILDRKTRNVRPHSMLSTDFFLLFKWDVPEIGLVGTAHDVSINA